MHARENDGNVSERAAAVPPPIELDALVPCGPDAAFDYFTRDIGRWWPLSRYSCSGERAASVSFEGGAGGMLIEVDVDGHRHVWGTVLAWAPGQQLAFTWHPGKPADAALTVAITFAAAGASTRVRLVHSGWEKLGATAAEVRASYASGWPTVLGQLYRGYCEGAAADMNRASAPGETR